MKKNPIPGNSLGEMEITMQTPLQAIRERRMLLIGGQAEDRRDEPRYIAEMRRLENYCLNLTPVLRRRDEDQAVTALNALSGHESDVRAQATEILLAFAPKPVEAAFTALMERSERWNEEDW